MAQPYSTKINDYINNPKKSTINTPLPVCQWLCTLIERTNPRIICENMIVDVGVGTGNLSRYFASQIEFIVGIDIDAPKKIPKSIDLYVVSDFLKWERQNGELVCPDMTKLRPRNREDMFSYVNNSNEPLVLCNPPFNYEGKRKKELLSFTFLKKIFEIFGVNTPVVLFAPMGMLLNQRMVSKRWREMSEDIDGLSISDRISSIISLPIDIFENVQFHHQILLFNMKMPIAHYFLPEYVIKEVQDGR